MNLNPSMARYSDRSSDLTTDMSNADIGLHTRPSASGSRLGRTPVNLHLAAACAVTLTARQAGVLHIGQGRVWVTFNCSGRAGDYFVGAGERFPLLAGQSVVLEPFSVPAVPGAGAQFRWEPLAASKALG